MIYILLIRYFRSSHIPPLEQAHSSRNRPSRTPPKGTKPNNFQHLDITIQEGIGLAKLLPLPGARTHRHTCLGGAKIIILFTFNKNFKNSGKGQKMMKEKEYQAE